MAIEKMVLLNMNFHQQDLDEVLFTLKQTRNFYPQSASKIVKDDKYKIDEDTTYTKLVERLNHIAKQLQLDLNNDFVANKRLNVADEETFLTELEQEINHITSVIDQFAKEKQENEITLKMLEHLSMSAVDLDQLQSSHYLTTRFGYIYKKDISKLKYYDQQPILFKRLGEDEDKVWCCYIVTHNLVLKVDNIFKALGFEEVKLPSFVHGTIDQARKELCSEVEAMKEYILRAKQKLTVLKETRKVDLMKLYSSVRFLERIEAYKVFVVNYQSHYAIYGFIPQRAIEDFKQAFQGLSIQFKELPQDTLTLQDVHAPLMVHNKPWIKPFEMLSHVEKSTSLDTTTAYAILYYVVFMVLLGDFGVGVVLGLLGLLSSKKKLGQLCLSLGVATFIGGLIYGSVFYSYYLYPPLIMPLSIIYRLLNSVMFIGVGTFMIQTYLKMKTYSSLIDKLFSFKGVCGMICVCVAMMYVICVYEMHMNVSLRPFEMIVVVCLVFMFVKMFMSQKTTS